MFLICLLLVVMVVVFCRAWEKDDNPLFALGIVLLAVALVAIYVRADITYIRDLEGFPPREYVACRTDKTKAVGEQVVLIYKYGITTQAVVVPSANFVGSENLPVCQPVNITVVTERKNGRERTTLVPVAPPPEVKTKPPVD